MNRYFGGSVFAAGGPIIPPPLLTFAKMAFVNVAPLISSPVNWQSVKFAPVKSTRGPTMYAPNELSRINTYGDGRRSGGPIVPPLFTLSRRVPEKSTPVTFTPAKLYPDKSAPAKLAPCKFTSGPIMNPPLTLLTRYLYAGVGNAAGGPIKLGPSFVFAVIAPVKFAPLTSIPESTQFVRSAPDKSTLLPTI